MTENEIKLLGLQKEDMGQWDNDESYYYVLDIANGLTFITPANDEIKNDEWYVEIFNTDPLIRFNEFTEVQGLINQLTNAIAKNTEIIYGQLLNEHSRIGNEISDIKANSVELNENDRKKVQQLQKRQLEIMNQIKTLFNGNFGK
jgi:hypothetical protein